MRRNATAGTLIVLIMAVMAAFLATAGTAAADKNGKYGKYLYNSDIYDFVDEDQLTFRTADRKAKASGGIGWLHVEKDDDVRRGVYSESSKVRAIKPVGCIWASVIFNYPTSSVSFGSGGISVTIQMEGRTFNFGYRCRKPGRRRPASLSLAGIGFPYRFLADSQLVLCTSRNKRAGPRYCAYERNTFRGD